MSKILVAGAGGAPSEGVINSLLQVPGNDVIGMVLTGTRTRGNSVKFTGESRA